MTDSKLHKIIKKYKIELERHNKSWEDVCRRAREKSTDTPTIYEHEGHNSHGNQLFKRLMEELSEVEIFNKNK